jgi:chromosome segregation and condensation protein ScpB
MQAPASDDSMLLAQEPVSEEQVAHALELHEALQVLSLLALLKQSTNTESSACAAAA